MSHTGYNSASGTAGDGQSMQPSHHQAPIQQHPQQQSVPSHAGMTYHQQQQQPSGPPYVIGPGQYNAAQFAYRQQQPPYQQQQSPTQQQHPQQAGRPTFIGISATANPVNRLPTSHHQSTTPYFVQQHQQPQSVQAVRMSQPQQQPQQQSFVGQQSNRPMMMATHQQPQQGQLPSSGHGQPQLIRVQQPPQMVHQVSGLNRMTGPGQVQVVATSTNSGMMMPSQYSAGQGAYSRPVILSQQPIVIQQQQPQHPGNVQILQQQSQPTIVQFPYKQQQPSMPLQLQQQLVIPKQHAAASPSSSTSSTPAPQYATPNQMTNRLDVSGGSNLSPSPSTAPGATSGNVSMEAAQSDSSQILTKQRLEDLVREVDPYEQLDEDVKEALLHIADEFIESVVSGACQIAKHRKANSVDVKDVQLCLERNWNMWIPGFGSDDIRPYKKACVTEAHKQRTALIKKTLKKI